MRFNIRPESVFFIGVTGGSCAGKSTFAYRLRDSLGMNYCHILCQDSYYKDQSDHFDHDGGIVNFDDPSSIDFDLLNQHLLQLQRGESIHVPVYDFATHKRLPKHVQMFPADIVLLEGALILTQPQIVQLLTESIFLDADEAIRLERRIKRDMSERGRTREGILEQFHNHVKPMHERFIEPVKLLATYTVFDEMTAQEVIEELVDKLGVDS